MQKIALVTTAHQPFDDRIYYQMALSLAENGYEVCIICSTEEISNLNDAVNIRGFKSDLISKKDKILKLIGLLEEFNPNLIICSEALAVYASWKFRKKTHNKVSIIYDITEWYPSKKNLHNKTSLNKITMFIKLLFFNYFASFLTNAFIFGEHYKGIPYKMLFPYKKSIKIGYYPNIKFIKYSKPNLTEGKICLGYTGKISVEKGINSFLEVIKQIKLRNEKLKVAVKIIGWFPDKNEEENFYKTSSLIKGFDLEILPYQKYTEFSQVIQNIDIFFDLRKVDLENNYCLPIKLFYYAACGKPVVYSDLKAIRKEIDISGFGYLVNPNDSKLIVDFIINYIKHPDLYNQHCMNARLLAETKYNWKIIEPELLSFTKSFF